MNNSIHITILSLFPDVLRTFLDSSIIGKALAREKFTVELMQIRDFTQDKHRTVDESPYGGGDGMLMKVDVLYGAWHSAREKIFQSSKASASSDAPRVRTILMSPQGTLWSQARAKNLSVEFTHLILICGRYEGVDERFIELCVDEEISVGDYVLTGGELPALIVVDSLARLLPGVVGKEGSVTTDSLEGNLLKYPQYTRPAEFMGKSVPSILLSGDHGAIAKWRSEESRARTQRKRPDLMAGAETIREAKTDSKK